MTGQGFDRLDEAIPLALLPVRLETRYLPRQRPKHLCVRIFPDAIHADGHDPRLTERELKAGRTYWTTIWGQEDEAVLTEAREWLARATGPYRALWVSGQTTPTNLGGGDDRPHFGPVPLMDAPQPTRARLLPQRWLLRLYDQNLQQVTEIETPVDVDPQLAVAPSLAAVDFDAKVGTRRRDHLDAFLEDQHLAWVSDFDVAVDQAGMGVRIPITDVPDPVGALIVVGVRGGRDPDEEAARLDELLAAHWYTHGLDVIEQGTPTNNTDAGPTAVSVEAPDVDALFEREGSRRPVATAGRGPLIAADPTLLYRLPAADTLSLVLGRAVANTLDRMERADLLEGAAAWGMNVALGYATYGFYHSEVLSTWMGERALGEHMADFSQWYIDWVRGAGPIPAIRCGEQPYGILPIRTRPAVFYGWSDDFDVKFEHYLTQLLPTWQASLPVATLDPDATDGRPGSAPRATAEAVAETLGAVPHPIGLQLRRAHNHLDPDSEVFVAIMNDLDEIGTSDAATIPNPDYLPDLIFFSNVWQERKPWIDGVPNEYQPQAQTRNLATQRVHVDLLVSDIERFAGGLADSMLDIVENRLRPLLDMYADATAAVPLVLSEWNGGGGVSAKPPAVIRGSAILKLVGTTYDEYTIPVIDLVSRDGTLDQLIDVLGRAIAGLRERAAPSSRAALIADDGPLLCHLVDQTYQRVPVDDVDPVILAFAGLRALARNVDHAEDQLERLMRESLGLAMHRLDAWITSLASRRLADLRRERPSGIQVGAYGWLLDLSKSDDPTSQGFIHAQSLSHAATAAVLRSGWSAFGTSSEEWPLSVNVSSDRVRGANWILDGVRNGQDLARLLGARLERYLHDGHLDVWIESVRGAVLTVTGAAGLPSAVVDGLLVARAYSEVEPSTVEGQLRAAIDGLPAPPGARPIERAAVIEACNRVADDLDSVADLLMVESVHSLLQGNIDLAAAALSATGGGDGSIPPMRSTATQRDIQLVEHRILVALSPEVGSDPVSAVAAAEPRVSTWLGERLPSLAGVGATVRITGRDGSPLASDALDLAGIGLEPIEAAGLAGIGPDQAASRLGRVLTALVAGATDPGLVIEIDFDDPGRSALSVNQFGLIAAAGLDAVGRARALTAEDLLVPGSEAVGAVDDDELEDRLDVIRSLYEEWLDDLVGGGDPGPALVRLAGAGVPGAVAALEAAVAGDVQEADRRLAAVIDRARTRLDTAADQDPITQLSTLIAGALPIAPVFTPVDDAERAASTAVRSQAGTFAIDGHAWLRQVGRVRNALGAMTDFLLLTDWVNPAGAVDLGLSQLPDDGSGWAATSKPRDDRDRLCLLALGDTDLLASPAAPMAGLLVDSWSEALPRTEQQTGIAFHFDAPTARAPQTILVSTTSPDTAFSADEIYDQLLQTIELAKTRAVGPDRVAELGHFLPATFLPDTVTISGGEG